MNHTDDCCHCRLARSRMAALSTIFQHPVSQLGYVCIATCSFSGQEYPPIRGGPGEAEARCTDRASRTVRAAWPWHRDRACDTALGPLQV